MGNIFHFMRRNVFGNSANLRSVIILLSFIAVMTGCEKPHEKHRGDVPGNPDNGGRDEPPVTPSHPDSIKRPGLDEQGYDYTKELSDATWRYVGGGVELKYSSPGVLFTVNTSVDKNKDIKRVEIIDIDGTQKVQCELGSFGNDSVVTGASLNVNGGTIELSRVLFKKVTGKAVWYHIMTNDGGNHVLVVPAEN